MTVETTTFLDRTNYTGYYDSSQNPIPLTLILLVASNTSTSAVFAIGNTTFEIIGTCSKIYPSGTSLSSIYVDGSLTNITDTKEYMNGTLYEHNSYSTGISLENLIYATDDPALVAQKTIYAGDDIFIGSTDISSGSTDNDYFVGFAGNDLFYGNAGGSTVWDIFLGGDGLDTAVFRGASSNYSVSVSRSSIWNHLTSLSDLSGYAVVDSTGLDSNQALVDVERLKFSDVNIALDMSTANSAGGIYRLYKAALNRAPDLGGLGYWIAQADAGTKDAVQMATDFTYATEFKTLYGVQTADNYMTGEDITTLVTTIYENVLNRAPDVEGRDYYVGQITTHSKTVGRVLAEIADSAENYAQVADLIATGITYIPWSA